MSEHYGALCSDFYVNQRLNLKMDLPSNRETILAMFDRVRREFPAMDQFKRYSNELALESGARSGAGPDQWLAIRRTNIRTGIINPAAPKDAYALHTLTLEVAPYYLSISPLDVDYLELLYGFDLMASGNHDAIVFDALIAGTPLAAALDIRGGTPIDCQPVFGIALGEEGDIQAHFEVKTRTPPGVRRGAPREEGADVPPEPISVYLTIRRHGAVKDVADLGKIFEVLSKHGEELLESRVIPNLLLPIRHAIASSNS